MSGGGDATLGNLLAASASRCEVNLGVVLAFNERLTWVMTRRTRLESTPSHPRHPGGHDLLLEPSGLSLFVFIDLALESLNLARPFGETDRLRLGYIVCPSTSGSVHGGKSREWLGTDVRFPTCPEQSNPRRRTIFVPRAAATFSTVLRLYYVPPSTRLAPLC